MRCIITYTRTGVREPFDGAEWVVNDLVSGQVTVDKIKAPLSVPFDDRKK